MRSLLAALTDRLEKRGADPTLPWGDSTPPTNGMLGSLSAGTNVTEDSAVGIAAVYTAASILTDAVSTLPIRQYRIVNGERAEMDPAPLVMQPWSEITREEFFSQGVYSQKLRGNAFGIVTGRDNRGFATQIMLVHPDKVMVRRDQKTGELNYRMGDQVVDLDDVFHIKELVAPGAVAGINPITALRNTLGLARAAELYQGSFYANSAQPGGILKVPGDPTRKEAREIAQQWNEQHQGIGKGNAIAIMGGGVEYQAIAISPEDAQFIQSRQFSRQEIGSMFRIPPHMMGDVDRTTSWGTGIEQQEIGFVRITLLGTLKRWEAALNAQLPRGQFVKFDLTERLRGDTLQRYQAAMLGRTGSFITVNEIRKSEGMPPVDGGDDPFAPLSSALSGGGGLPNPMGTDPGSQKSPSQ